MYVVSYSKLAIVDMDIRLHNQELYTVGLNGDPRPKPQDTSCIIRHPTINCGRLEGDQGRCRTNEAL